MMSGGDLSLGEAGTTGATHFLEHMMFKGAKKFAPVSLKK